MAIDIDEFARLFESDPVDKVREVFGVPEVGLVAKDLNWKGQTIKVYDFELFKMIIKDWMVRYKQTKEQAIDEFFGMF